LWKQELLEEGTLAIVWQSRTMVDSWTVRRHNRHRESRYCRWFKVYPSPIVYPFTNDRSDSSKICTHKRVRERERNPSAWSSNRPERSKWKCRSTWGTDLFSRWLNSFWRRSLTHPIRPPAGRQTVFSFSLLFSSWIRALCTLDRCQILR